jgi:N-acetylglucosamine-6-phosphate deacetylase
MTMRIAYIGAKIFDGAKWHDNAALVVNGDHVESIVDAGAVPYGVRRNSLNGGMLVPGFIDLQVNGGGGHLLGAGSTVDDIRNICSVHAQFGTTGLLPTLITDTPANTQAVIEAGEQAAIEALPGFLGLHLEGPHLSLARKGAHNPAYIRPMDEADLVALVAANDLLPNLLVTVAAETVTPEQIGRLVAVGIVVSLGHTDASFKAAIAAAEAGATMATHLFNAMSQIGNREPGVAGATLHHGHLYAGLIADGIHVDPATIGIALRAKAGPAKIFLVSDAMAQTGTDITNFTLNGRTITRADGALRLEDGTLAGADLTMIDAVAFMHRTIGLPLEEALRMASLYPAEAMDIAGRFGHLHDHAFANFLHLSSELTVKSTWIDGKKVFG